MTLDRKRPVSFRYTHTHGARRVSRYGRALRVAPPYMRLFEIPASEQTTEAINAGRYQSLGVGAQMLLVARLLEMGHKVAVPVTDDDGVDLVVNYRTLVQVKSSESRAADGSLRVALTTRRSSERNGRGWIREHVDVLAVYARDTQTWWFLPRDAVNHGTLNVTERGPRSAWREAWHLFDGIAA